MGLSSNVRQRATVALDYKGMWKRLAAHVGLPTITIITTRLIIP
jgi:hypothetical protein